MKLNVQNVKIIDCHDWDELVQKTYKRPYCFQQQSGCQDRGLYELVVPDMYPEDFTDETVPEEVNHKDMGVSFAAWLARDPKAPIGDGGTRHLKLWWERNFYPDFSMIGNDLYSKGLLDAGNYEIRIDW